MPNAAAAATTNVKELAAIDAPRSKTQGAHLTDTNEIQQPGNNQRRTRPEKPHCCEGKVPVYERGESTVNNAEHKQCPSEHLIQTFHAAKNSTRDWRTGMSPGANVVPGAPLFFP